MKALILAAGFGTRLAPYTNHLPKALFPVGGIPVLGRMIAHLTRAGCTSIAVNTHHLAEQVRWYVKENDFGVPIKLSHEPEILGTGGALRRLADYWDHRPFVVVNADIITDIDLARCYRRHCDERAVVSLVVHDHPPFNQVWIDGDSRITGFGRFDDPFDQGRQRQLAFTGIHILDPQVLQWIPPDGFCDIISVYRQMIAKGMSLHAQEVRGHYWQDMGNPQRFRDAVVDVMAPAAFQSAFPGLKPVPIRRQTLCGDGSDRGWYRLTADTHHLILADHGITPTLAGSEVNAFVSIGNHLHACGLPVPRIHLSDGFSGLVFLEDLGDRHLQAEIQENPDAEAIRRRYQRVIDTWLDLTVNAAEGFDPAWTCQSRAYDIPLILDKECRYFVEAFVNGYLALDVDAAELADDFSRLARRTIEHGIPGIIHRDFQSRNIMLLDDHHYLIDFQGARSGPIQYDLASLLIDPYATLDRRLQEQLLAYAVDQAGQRLGCSAEGFRRGYRYCAITRNLQMLGAFGYLSRVKRKPVFERYIPRAVAMLAEHLRQADNHAFPRLKAVAETIRSRG